MSWYLKFFSVVLVIFFGQVIGGCSNEKSVQEQLETAQKSMADGNEKDAVINLKNILKLDSNHGKARYLLGSIYAQHGFWSPAEKEFVRAHKFGFVDNQLLPVLAKVLYKLNDTKGLEELLIDKKEPSEYNAPTCLSFKSSTLA